MSPTPQSGGHSPVMPFFLEKMILPALTAVLVAFGVTNPLALSWQARLVASVIVLAIGFAVSWGLYRHNRRGVTPTAEAHETSMTTETQEFTGSITCRRSGPVTTYYPIPFSRPPHLTIDLTRGSCEWITTEQQPEGFTIEFGSSSYSTSSPPVLTWTAKGLPIKSHSDQG